MAQRVVQLAAYRHYVAEDVRDLEQNALWDTFAEQAAACGEWRDHEELDRLERLIAELRPGIEVRR